MAKKGSKKTGNGRKDAGTPQPTAQPIVPQSAPPKKPAPKTETKMKRGIAASVEVPSVVVPFMIWVAVYLVSHFAAKYDARLLGFELDILLMLIAGGATLLFFIAVPLFRNRGQLTKPFAKRIVYGGSAVALIVCGLGVFVAADWGTSVAEGTLRAGPEMTTVNLPSKHLKLFVQGKFPDKDREQIALADAEAKAAAAKEQGQEVEKVRRAGSYKLAGAYELRLVRPDTGDAVESYKGKFEQERKRRRLSKRARGYLDVVHTTQLFDLRVDRAGEYNLQLALVGGDLESNVEFAVYRDLRFPVVISVLGAIIAFFFGLIDTLVKPLRVDSYFAPAIGIAFGFTAYFASTTIPGGTFSGMGVSLMVGAVMGGGSAYGLYLISGKVYEKIIRKYMWSLN